MIITQPEDKTLTKERIEAILIALNELSMINPMEVPLLSDLNKMPNLKGKFTLSEKGDIVFVAH
jgi:hypothetical protein